jgi:hypothetical protein
MRRAIVMSIAVLSCSVGFNVATTAQTSESKTKVKAEHGNAVTYTGCVQPGTETRTYILQGVVPIAKTETIGTSGAATTTTYMLVPEGKVELQEQVGHKVEVSGVLIPAGKGDAKIKTKTKTKGSEEETKAEVERGAMPQLKVISVKPVPGSCS